MKIIIPDVISETHSPAREKEEEEQLGQRVKSTVNQIKIQRERG